MIAAKKWNGKSLTGVWEVTLKIDGVRALSNYGNGRKYLVVSRKDKPLYNLDHLAHLFNDAEIWLGDFKTTISAVRSSTKVIKVPKSAVYNLDPMDRRLRLGITGENPTPEVIKSLLRLNTRPGCDGIMLRQGERWLKVKHKDTLDVKVTGYKVGKGKHAGRLGALLTTKGRVGTGFSDALRSGQYRRRFPIGCVVEVEALEMTEKGRFRHARFLRLRTDKS